MGTKKETTQQIQYDPLTGQARSAVGADIPTWQQYIQHPFDNPFFTRMLGLGTQAAEQGGQTMQRNILNNLAGSTYGNLPGFLGSEMNAAGRAESGLQSNAVWNAIANALQQQRTYSGLLEAIQPLQTGQHTTEKTSGLGTWLPQAINAAVGMAAAPFTGGLSMAMPMFGGPGGGLSHMFPSQFGMAGTTPGGTGGLGGVPLESYGLPTSLTGPNLPSPFLSQQPSQQSYGGLP